MNYNIDFDIAAALIAAVTYAFNVLQYPSEKKSNKLYRMLLFSTFLGAVLDAFTGLTDSDPTIVPRTVNMLLNTLFFMISVFLGFIYYRYACCIVYNGQKRKADKITFALLVIYFVIIISNVFTGIIFTLDNNVYAFGPLHVLTYIYPGFYVTLAWIVTLKGRKLFKKKQLIAILFFGPSTAIGMFFQMLFFPNILVTYICTSFGCMGLLFTLETPDYQKLMKTMAELDKAREDAEVATKSKSEFLARMSHEIRTPINAVLGMDEMILRECEDNTIVGYAVNIQNAGNSLLSIINDILDFSKIESGKFEITPAEYKLRSLVHDCRNLVSARMEDKGLVFTVEVDENCPSVMIGDEFRIRQIVTNLLTNAAKYTHKGSVCMSVKWKKDEKKSDGEGTSGVLSVAVKDTGIGVAPENIEKLFTAFERVDSKSNHVIEGTGLGLSITKQLAELMKGTVTVESELGKGSIFTMVIPQNCPHYEPIGKIDYEHDGAAGGHKEFVPGYVNANARILVVDDVQMNLEVMQALLKKTLMRVDIAISGREALELIKENKYDLILMDHMMPDMDGIETLKFMRETENNPNEDVPVVVLTANAINGVEQMYFEAGFAGYLSKPVSYAEVERTLVKFIPLSEKN